MKVKVLAAQSCLALCESRDCSLPGSSVHGIYQARKNTAVDCILFQGFPGAQLVKNPPAKRETQVQSLGWEDPLEKRTATHSSILAWRIPWTV